MVSVKELCSQIERYNKDFKAKTYADAVEDFYSKYKELFIGLNDKVETAVKEIDVIYCDDNTPQELEQVQSIINKSNNVQTDERQKLSPQMQTIVDKVAMDFIEEVAAVVRYKGKLPKGRYLVDVNIFMVMYVFPGIIATQREYAFYIAETIGKKWPEIFGGNELGCADYDTINSGFKRKLCYITTAVCDSLGKEDDCEELNMLRDFRDGYMTMLPSGKQMIEEYYETAPGIVQRINLMENATQIYSKLYKEYICPCIDMIKKGRLNECLNHYRDMVEKLR